MPRRPLEFEPLRVLAKTIDASYYNRGRLALIRIGDPLRVALPGLLGLEAILSDEMWLVVDSLRTDNPVLAWCDFATAGRESLHEPVRCNLKLYHSHAGLIMGTALEALQTALNERLGPTPDAQPKDDPDC